MAMPQLRHSIFVAIATLSFYLSFTSLSYAQETGTATYNTPPYLRKHLKNKFLHVFIRNNIIRY